MLNLIRQKSSDSSLKKGDLFATINHFKKSKGLFSPTAEMSLENRQLLIADLSLKAPNGTICEEFHDKLVSDLQTLITLNRNLKAKILQKILKEEYSIENPFFISKENLQLVLEYQKNHTNPLNKRDPKVIYQDFDFSVDPWTLMQLPKTKCRTCSRKIRIYCDNCILPSDLLKLPRLKLPVRLVVIYDSSNNKSLKTSLHAGLVAPYQTEYYSIFDKSIANLKFDRTRTAMLFPTKDAVLVSDLPRKSCSRRTSAERRIPCIEEIDTVIMIDSKWKKVRSILQLPCLHEIAHIAIRDRETLYWHSQKYGKDHLSSIEAIYYLMKEMHLAKLSCFDGSKRKNDACEISRSSQKEEKNEKTSEHSEASCKIKEDTYLKSENKMDPILKPIENGESLETESSVSLDNLMVFFASSHKRVFDETRIKKSGKLPVSWEIFPQGFLESLAVREN